MSVHIPDRAVVILGDCREAMADFPAEAFDAIITDPPYEFGFMNKGWDKSGVAFSPSTWTLALAVAKPGAHLLAFGGTRTVHRLACAIEDAGWEIRDTIAWLYGSGYPKSHNVSKAIDAALGAQPLEVGRKSVGNGNRRGAGFNHDGDTSGVAITEPVTEDAKRWEGWGTALKPGREDIIVARKPLRGTVAANVREHGTGGLNIARCRIAGASTRRSNTAEMGYHGGNLPTKYETGSDAGRWPANVVLDEEAAALLDEQSGTLKSGANPTRRRADKFRNTFSAFAGMEECTPARGVDIGGASRFYYCAKASAAERNAGLEHLPDQTLARSNGAQGADDRGEGYGDEGSVGLNRTTRQKNNHPTVKPLELMRWLVRLVTPPGGVILDPFCGSGSTGVAARAEGFRFVGVEQNPEYHAIAKARVVELGPLFDG